MPANDKRKNSEGVNAGDGTLLSRSGPRTLKTKGFPASVEAFRIRVFFFGERRQILRTSCGFAKASARVTHRHPCLLFKVFVKKLFPDKSKRD